MGWENLSKYEHFQQTKDTTTFQHDNDVSNDHSSKSNINKCNA